MLHLGTIRGTTIAIDFSFIILCIFFVVMNFNAQRGIQYALLWVPILFISVLVHEAAHASMFGLFGYGSSEIVLGGMGGHTLNRNVHTKAWHDLLISAAGPLSNFGLTALAWVVMRNTGLMADPFFNALLPLLLWVNVFWGVFNLIPLKPLDGGHAIRSFTRLFMSDRKSFVVSIWIGIVVGSICALAAAVLTRQYFIALFIAWYVFMNFQAWQDFKERGYPGD
ncbi:MAG TPA: site-2 protease family protein [Thermoanaerobaculia bacterium]